MNYVGSDEGGGIGGYDKVFFTDLKVGDYSIKVIPNSETLLTDFYTLKITSEGSTIILAENARIGDIPQESYIVRVSEDKIERIVPAKVRIGPHTINIKSNGRFTAFIKFPKGFEFSVSDIDTQTIMVHGAPVTKATVVKDTIIAKFSIQDLENLTPDKKAEIRVTGKLKNGVSFEGTDTVRIINDGSAAGISFLLAALRDIFVELFSLFRDKIN